MSDIYTFLADHQIPYQRFDHTAVFTVEESAKLPPMPGIGTKNLFLRDKNGERHFLVVVGHDKNVDLKALKETLGLSKLSFASPERMKKYLDVEPGSVTLLGLMNDTGHAVEVIIDEPLWNQELQCHPLINTGTLAIPAEGIQKFLKATGHQHKVLLVPARPTEI